MKIPNVESIEPSIELTRRLRQGNQGIVYRLGNDKVAKFQLPTNIERRFYGWRYASQRNEGIIYEFEIATRLYEGGVSVPRPHGIFMIKPFKEETWSKLWFPKRFPGFVMEYIKGIPDGKGLEDKTKRTVVELGDIEREKARKLGFEPSGQRIENTIWIPDKEKVYLVDFGEWNCL